MPIMPMDIPELRLMVAQFLDEQDYFECTVVCRAWHVTFQPLVWEKLYLVDTEEKRLSASEIEARRMSFRNNVHHTKVLYYSCLSCVNGKVDGIPAELFATLIDRCHSLVELSGEYRDAIELFLLKTLIKSNKGLQDVTLKAIDDLSPLNDLKLYEIFIGCSQLRRLEVDCSMTADALFRLVDTIPHLEKLVIGAEAQRSLSQEPALGGNVSFHLTAPSFPELWCVSIEGTWHDPRLTDLLARCPSLTRLGLSDMDIDLYNRICELLHSHRFPRLCYLEPCHRGDGHFYEGILRAVPPNQLEEVKLFWPEPDDLLQLVECQRESLLKVTIHFDSANQHPALVNILARCSKLRTLLVLAKHDPVDVRRLIGEQWTCSELSYFNVPLQVDTQCTDDELISLGAAEKEATAPGRLEWEQAQAVFFKRVGQLTKLTLLDVQLKYVPSYPQGRVLSLSYVLPHLVDLSRLKILNLGRQLYVEGIAELRLMKRLLPHLGTLQWVRSVSDEQQLWLNTNWPQFRLVALPNFHQEN